MSEKKINIEHIAALARLKLAATEKKRLEVAAERAGLQDEIETIAGSLSHGQKQWLEIAMVILQEPKLFLVDEPAAGMTDEETHRTGEMLKELAKDRSIVVIEHDMEFVRQIANIVTVLHEGRILVQGPMATVQNDKRVIECYLGSSARESKEITGVWCYFVN